MADYSAILNDTLTIPKIEHLIEVNNDLMKPEILELLRKTYQRDIFVICKNKRTAGYLLDEMVDCLHSSIDKVDHMRGIVKMGYENWRFISQAEMDIKLRGYRAEIVYDVDFERALDIYKNKKESKNDCTGSLKSYRRYP